MRALGVIVAAVAFLVSAPAEGTAQSDLTGMWDLTLMTDQGGQTFTVDVVQDGQELTATGDVAEFGQFEMKGTFDGSEVRFAWVLDLQGTPLDIVFTGTLTDGVLSGTADFGGIGQGDWSAKRAAD